MEFSAFCKAVHIAQGYPDPALPVDLVALDPGETTGYAHFHAGKLVSSSQLPTHRIKVSVPILQKVILPSTSLVVYEDYRIYAWKTESHAWASLHTPKLLGVIETVAHLTDTPTFTQMAQQAKQFCTDQKLKEWGYYQPGLQHARDAIRHGCYYLLFNLIKPVK